MLIDADPDRFFKPPYVGPRGWVGVVLDSVPDWGAVAMLVRDAYVHVASRKLLAQLSPSNESRPKATRANRKAKPVGSPSRQRSVPKR
jgi:hypothetical protein